MFLSARRTSSAMGEKSLGGNRMRLLRATVISVVGAAAVLLAPGVASADTGITQQECEPLWFWWIPLPCPHE